MIRRSKFVQAIRGKLERAGYKVYEDFVPQTFVRPCCVLDIGKFQIRPHKALTIEVNSTFFVAVLPKQDARKETAVRNILNMQDDVIELLYASPLEVEDRKLTFQIMPGEVGEDRGLLQMDFFYFDDVGDSEESPQMEEVSVNLKEG